MLDAPSRQEPLLAGATVLVVDDDSALRWAVARVLAGAGADVRQAADGEEAIALADTERVDLLLTDMEMPGRDGADIAFAIAAICPEVAIVFMSGRSREHHIANGRLAGHDRLVEKPFDSKALVKTLATALASVRGR